MPLYEYECTVCARRFEVIRKLSDPPVENCPTCGGAVRKRQSAPAFQFKGSGWYVTDYSSKLKSKEEKKPEAEKKKEPTAASAKTESGSKQDSPSKPDSSPKKESSSKS